MPNYLAPGVYIEELSSGVKPIEGVSTSVAAFVGVTEKGPVGKAFFITNFAEFTRHFGGPLPIYNVAHPQYLYHSVKHFFEQGGTKCYIVRVVPYADPNDPTVLHDDADPDDPSTIQPRAASRTFNGLDSAGTSVAGALEVSAPNPGAWGEELSVGVEHSSKFSLLLHETVATANDIVEFSLEDNDDVVVGSVLWLVQYVSGTLKEVTIPDGETTAALTFRGGLTEGSGSWAGDIAGGETVKVFTDDFRVFTTANQAATVAVTADEAPVGITLAEPGGGVLKRLGSGDLINFVTAEVMVVVTKVKAAYDEVLVDPDADPNDPLAERKKVPYKVVEFTATNFAEDYEPAMSRVFARDFSLIVQKKGDEVERLEHLTLIDANEADHIASRLSGDGSESAYVVARDTGTAAVLMAHSEPEQLQNGSDGLEDHFDMLDANIMGSEILKTGLHALDLVTDASILVVPNASGAVANDAKAYCEKRMSMLYVADFPDAAGKSETDAFSEVRTYVADKIGASSYAALYYPWIKIKDPLSGIKLSVPPSGAIAGVYAKTDSLRGVHKAPAGIDTARLNVAAGSQFVVSKDRNDMLYQEKINVIRNLPEGIVVWGARTLSSDPEWKYINVRRLFIFLEQSIERGTQWVVFEPNDRTLWKSIKRNVEAFLRIQWNEGKLVGKTEEEAFYVKCDEETNPQEIIDAGYVITEIGVAPSKPAEFVIFRIKQAAGGAAGQS